jgi:hypothetical protein
MAGPPEKNKDEENGSVSPSQQPDKKVEWTPENEKIMAEWCDIAQCYKWLHTRAHQKYSTQHAWFTIPAITLSTISGTASFAQSSLPVSMQSFAPMAIGALNIFIGILTTIQQYLKISELNESHRVASISWDKFSRNIRVELAKSPIERMDCGSFLKMSRQDFDRMMETSPSIPIKIVQEFNRTFEGKPDSPERKRFDALKKPDICDIIETVKMDMYDRSKEVYAPVDDGSINIITHLEEKMQQKELEMQKKLKDIEAELVKKAEAERLKRVEDEKRTQHRIEMKNTFAQAAAELSNQLKSRHKEIDDYVTTFANIYGRKPLEDELVENFKDDMDEDILESYLVKYTHTDENV